MVHQYKLGGYCIVLDSCSGSVHSVDDVAYDIIALYQKCTAEEIVDAVLKKYPNRPDVTKEEILLCLEDIAALEKAGKFIPPCTKNVFLKFYSHSANQPYYWSIEDQANYFNELERVIKQFLA